MQIPAGPDIRDHGGDLAAAIARFGGVRAEWLDLSTGINPCPWPVPDLPAEAWTRLPEADALAGLCAAARTAYEAAPEADLVAAPGASSLIRLMPRLGPPARVAIPGPTYNEHAAAFHDHGWEVTERPGPGVTAAVIVNPNNPDGRLWPRDDLRLMAEALDLLVIDESFMDPDPTESMASEAGDDGLIVLRSFGKFYGLGGVRLGFAITSAVTAGRLREMLGPWAVSGPAIEIGTQALRDRDWAEAERARLVQARARLSAICAKAGWHPVGGSDLFQTVETGDAAAARDRLARHRIWARIFPYSTGWLRLGLPGSEAEWLRLEAALV